MNNTNQMLDNVNTDQLLADTLQHFETMHILDIVRYSINIRFRPYSTAMPGLNATEMYFQQLLENFESPDHKSQILEVRRKTYDEIIDTVCKFYGLEYTPDENVDNYTVAYFLYNVLVSNFTETIINFYVNYIIDHKDDIIATLNIDKDTIDTYSKKIYGVADKLGIIHSQVNKVMDNITAMDIRFNQLLQYGSGDIQCITILGNTITDINDVFHSHFAPFVTNPGSRADMITNVKLRLQEFAMAEINIVAPIKQ